MRDRTVDNILRSASFVLMCISGIPAYFGNHDRATYLLTLSVLAYLISSDTNDA